MRKHAVWLVLLVPALWMIPSIALASPEPEIPIVPSTAQWVLSLVGMVVVVFGLYMISNIGKLTGGGAISGGARYVVSGFLCLGAASVLTVAVYSFKLAVSADYVAYIEEALRIVAMGLFVQYFHTVLTGLRGYVKDLEEASGGASAPSAEDAGA